MARKIHVVHMTTVHHPYDPRIYHKECKSLDRHGFDVTLIAQASNDHKRKNNSIKHIPIKKYKSRLKRMIAGSINVYKIAKSLKADIYHFHDPELLPIGWLLKNKRNIVIYDIHEDYVTSILQKQYLIKPLRKIIALMYKLIEKLFAKKMDLCLAEKYYQEIYPRGKCILNYPTLNDRLIKHERTYEHDKTKLLYTGNVTVDRGALIHANLPNIHGDVSIQFVGKCQKQLAQKMYEVAGTQKDQLYIEGIDELVEKETIEQTYINENWLAGVALFPPTEHYMKKELTKFFEYMSAGLPIICSNFPVWKRFIDQYQCGIAVDPHDEEAIKHAIDFLKDNPETATQMGANGKKAVIEELNWNREEEKLIKWYNELLDKLQ